MLTELSTYDKKVIEEIVERKVKEILIKHGLIEGDRLPTYQDIQDMIDKIGDLRGAKQNSTS